MDTKDKVPELKKLLRTKVLYIAVAIVIIGLVFTIVHFVRYGGKIPIKIVSFEPQGEVPERTNFTIEFSSNVVDESIVDVVLDEAPVTFKPPILGRFKWISRHTLRFYPEVALNAATPYTVDILPAICAKEDAYLKGKRRFSFNTEPLKIVHSATRFVYEQKVPVETRIEYTVEFNHPVAPEELRKHIKLYYELAVGHADIAFTLHPSDTARIFRVISEPIARGEKEQSAKIMIDKGLLCISGLLGLSEDFISPIKVEPNLKIYSVYPKVTKQQAWIRIEFSSPVDPYLAKEYITIEPEVDFRVEQSHRYLNITGAFKPREHYKVMIKEGLPGRDGTFLQKDYATTVQIRDLEPSVSFQTEGIYLPRKGLTNLGIETVNIKAVRIEAHKIFSNNLAYLLVSSSPHRPYPQRYLGKSIYSEKISVSGERNQLITTVLDIGQFMEGKRRGLFHVIVRDEDHYWRNDSKWVMVTDLGIVAKRAEGDLFVWVNSLKTLSPVPDVEIKLISKTNQVLARGRTNSDGILIIRDLENKIEGFEPLVITAEKGEDLSFLKFDDCRLPTSAFDVGGRAHITSGYEAFLYTDRGVFRPNDKAHIVAIVRGKDVGLPTKIPVKLELRDPTYRIFKELSKKIDSQGEVEFEVTFPAYARTGKYVARLLVADKEIGRTEFQVEEFIPDKIKVKVGTDKASYLTGDDVVINIAGISLFGSPAVGRQVEATCDISAHPFTPPKWKNYTFGDEGKEFKETRIEIGEGILDDEGKHEFTFNIPKDIYPPAALKGVIIATVKEHGGRAVSAYTSVDIHPYPFYIGLRSLKRGYAEIGKKYEVEYVVVNTSGERALLNVLSVDIYRVVWHSVLKRDSEGYYRYVSEKSAELIESYNITSKEKKRISFVPPRYGQYKIVVRDPASNTSSTVKFYASGWGYAPWSLANPDRIEIDTDKESYIPGMTAKVQIRAPFPGKMLLTIERDKVITYQIHILRENTAAIEIPVKSIYKPNVYVTATIIRSMESYDGHTPLRAYGTAPLKVDCSQHKVSIDIRAPETIRPKTKLNLDIRVKGQSGVTQLTVAAVDEGICQLTDFITPDPFNFFFAKKRLNVSSYDIYSLILPEVKPQERGTPAGGYLEKVRKKHITPVSIKRVKPVSLWSGIVKTDANGRAKVNFDVPEFQGRLRVMVVAAAGPRFGSAREDVIVRDPIVLMPTFPRFLAAKDKFSVPVTIYNGCGKTGKFNIVLEVDGPVEIIGKSKKTVKVLEGKESIVFYDLKAKAAIGKAVFKLSATGLGEKTEVTTEVPVRPSAPMVTKVGSDALTAKAPLEITLPGGWISGTENAQIIISAFPTVKFSKSLQWLLRYPHGCVEQTTSRVFPLLYFDDIAKIAEPELFKANSAEYYIEEGIAKLQSMQHESGGFGFWPGHVRINDWSSIYASHFLIEAKKADFFVSKYVYKKMLGYLKEIAKREADGRWKLQCQAYACYVLALAGYPQLSTMRWLKENRLKEMSTSSQFHLAGAFALAGDMNTAMSLVPTQIQPQKVDRETGRNFNSSIRENAIILNILAEINPESPGVPVLVKELSGLAKAGRWYTTQDNAFAFLALGKILRKQARGQFKGTIHIGGKRYKDFTEKGLTIEDKALAGKELAVRIDGKGSCYLYWQVWGVPEGANFEEYDKGIRVRREFLNRDAEPINYKDLKQGEIVVARITMEALHKNLDNVIICDLLPAGLEIENPRLASRGTIPWVENKCQADYMDIRDDRLLLYLSLRKNRVQTFYYALRAVTCGEFTLPPVSAECMYDPTYSSIASSGMITATK